MWPSGTSFTAAAICDSHQAHAKPAQASLSDIRQFAHATANALANGSRGAPAGSGSPALMQTLAYLTQVCPSFSLRGGTRQILRGIVARGLGLR